ncbi:MAG: gfo/Idh/MocA family oxidoreductase [Acidobacteria bacterium]|nr:gfo/Idh/MocA family oxidoreductase [Acidobacteriota bacterium]
MNRRTFVRNAAVFAAATQARPILGANDRINLAVVGVGGRGTDHIEYFSALPDQKIVAVVDVNQPAQERAQALVRKLQGHDPVVYADMRKAFDSKEIDAVSIATPNHWHALSTIWACHAGKDVYCEKPASHDLYEGRQMIAAARKHRRMVQVGSQSRSIAHKRQAMQMLHEGVIGEVFMARGLCYRRRKSIGTTPVEPVPAGLDWDLFLGPAPMRPYSKNRFAYNWHWFWDTGNGDIGNQGVHEMDICRWGLGLKADEEPEMAVSTGGKFVWQDEQETPNTQQASYSYRGKEIVFDVRNLNTGTESQIPLQGSMVGNLFYGSEGFMIVYPTGFQVFMGDEHEKTVDEKNKEEKVWDPKPHMQNFLDGVRARDPKVLHADIAEGVAAAALVHYANASYRLGRVMRPDPLTGRILDDGAANQILERPGREPYRIPELA